MDINGLFGRRNVRYYWLPICWFVVVVHIWFASDDIHDEYFEQQHQRYDAAEYHQNHDHSLLRVPEGGIGGIANAHLGQNATGDAHHDGDIMMQHGQNNNDGTAWQQTMTIGETGDTPISPDDIQTNNQGNFTVDESDMSINDTAEGAMSGRDEGGVDASMQPTAPIVTAEGNMNGHVNNATAKYDARQENNYQTAAQSNDISVVVRNNNATTKSDLVPVDVGSNRSVTAKPAVAQHDGLFHASLEAARKSLEVLKHLYTTRCEGENVDPPKWWTFHYDCPKNVTSALLPADYSALANTTHPNNKPYNPRIEIEGIHWYGQMLDFTVAEMFFLHPVPVRGGRFLEIGAFTGLEFSNTLFFEHYLGWEGWLFEPTSCYEQCKRNRPRAKVFQQGLCPNATEMEFEAYHKCEARVSKCVPLTDMDKDWSRGFDFVSIDVEGSELDVLRAIDLNRVPVKVLVIEWRERDGDSRSNYLAQFGYVLLENILLFNPKRGDEIYYRPDLIQPHIFRLPT